MNNEWQPIETAPMVHGKRVILWWPHWSHEACIGTWHHNHWISEVASYFVEEIAPTHWMPLPDPPESFFSEWLKSGPPRK